jgi:hypothetical protein
MEIPVRMRQTRMHSGPWESPPGFKCQTRSTSAFDGLAAEDGKSDFDLVHPGGMGWREVETQIGIAGEPVIALGLVGGQVVEHDKSWRSG